MVYATSKTVSLSYDQAIEQVTSLFKAEGFGVLTEMMQAMMADGEMDQSKMMEMAGIPSMMKMHMMCMQMMQGTLMGNQGMMNQDSMNGNTHQQHHN
ncbi:hypothetical protein [Rhodohalobacter sp. 8-1]|uniref:hypothetical protein n=1 Tax=Rhodohalobacter sp. 8-1 TaxID=3131972 RepID=UPI0030ECCDD4